MIQVSDPGFAGIRRVMIFLDGGYIRNNMKRMFRHDEINYEGLVDELRRFTSYGRLFPELIRVYYYDANFEARETDALLDNDLDSLQNYSANDFYIREYEDKIMFFKDQEKYLNQLKNYDYFEIRLGRLKNSKKGLRQKGVDTLIAIDMISKAYEDHYDVAVLVTGDDDLLDVVRIVKNTGKRVFGAFFEKTVSQELRDEFDKRKVLDKSFMTNMQTTHKKEQNNLN